MIILPESSAWRIFLRWYRVLDTKIVPPNKSDLKKHLHYQDQRCSLMLFPGNPLGPRVLHPSWKELRHHCLSSPKQLDPSPERQELPFPSEEILSGYEEIVSSCTDQFTAWVETDPGATLVRQVVDVQKAVAEFRSGIPRQQKFIYLFARAEASQRPQLESRSPTRKGRCL